MSTTITPDYLSRAMTMVVPSSPAPARMSAAALLSEYSTVLAQCVRDLNGVIQGKPDVIIDAMTAVLAGGHVLLEDVPGVGKTTLARAIAAVLGCSFRRIQFTSDLLPSDIIGVHIFRKAEETFEFRPGPVFANIVLADEINRTTPKTQSSLLEAMNERQISADNETHPLPLPFLVIATQNPQDFQGTYPLPESQLDRFMLRLELGYPETETERSILRERNQSDPVESLTGRLDAQSLMTIQSALDGIRVDDGVLDYMLAIIGESRRHPDLVLGVSTRGALALQKACRARALLMGRDYVIPEDVKRLAGPCLAHRVQLSGRAASASDLNRQAHNTIDDILTRVSVPL